MSNALLVMAAGRRKAMNPVGTDTTRSWWNAVSGKPSYYEGEGTCAIIANMPVRLRE
jgi:hypothetical protein